jgi:hypothetical protein
MGFYPGTVSLRQHNPKIHKSHTQYTYHIHNTQVTYTINISHTQYTSHIHNTQVTYTIHISHKITQLKAKKQKKTQVSSQSYTNSEGPITDKGYSVETRKGMNLSLIRALEAY